MNLFILKYCLLIGAILTSTALVAGPLNPLTIMPPSQDNGNLSADAVYQFGSDVFYKELDKPGNEYLKNGVAGYSQNFVTTDSQEQHYDDQWSHGVAAFKSGYSGTIDAYLELAAVPQMNTPQEKNTVCEKFGQANEELKNAIGNFTSAKASSTASSEHGFTIGMVLERAGPIQLNAEDAQISCMKAVLADREGNSGAFE